MPDYRSHNDEYGRMAWLISKVVTIVIYWYLVAVEIILFLGFILLLTGANPSSSFVSWAYRSLDSAMAPFRGMFHQVELGEAGAGVVSSVFDTSILFAMVVYGLFLAGCASLLHWINRRIRRMDAEDRLSDRQRAYEQARTQWQPSDDHGLPDVVGMQEAAGNYPTPGSSGPPVTRSTRVGSAQGSDQSSWDDRSDFDDGSAS